MEFLGDKTIALFDLWSLQHLVVGFMFGWCLARNVTSSYSFVLIIFGAAYGWELFEFLAEIGVLGAGIANWFGGVEFVINRLFIDPLTLLFGSMLGKKIFENTPAFIFASTLAFTWLVINLLSVDVMAIQEQILK